MEDSIARLGYLGVLMGTFIEGETTILLAGIFAKFGYLKLREVILFAFLGTFFGDCCFFFLGKFFGRSVIERYEFLRTRAAVSGRIIHRYRHLIIFVMRFLAGFRSIILVLLGCTDVRSSRFVVIDMAACLVWSISISFVGFAFANVVYIFVSDIQGYEKIVIPLLVIPAIGAILFYRHFIKEKEEEEFDRN
jgi:membrane protein DedA with SNARE-associated domain